MVRKSEWMRWPGHVAYREEKSTAYKVFSEKLERKRPLGRPGRRGAMLKTQDVGAWMYVVMASNRWRVVVDRVMNLQFHKTRELPAEKL
jgi:hypothetical protein